MSMGFSTEPEPPRLVAIKIKPGVFRMVAENPGAMTYHGTNTWLVEEPDGFTVIDPGPDQPAHIEAVARFPIARILLTHSHPDHLAGAPALKTATGAPIAGFAKPWAKDFVPDETVADGQRIGALTAIHTPGHASDHLCFSLPDGTLFSGDHVMSWSTSIVSPPDGDMADYMESLRLLLGRADTLYLCGHGPPLMNPAPLVRAMLLHRCAREAAVLGALTGAPQTETVITEKLYAGLTPNLARAAARTVTAHLLKLKAEGKVVNGEGGWRRE